MLNKSKGKSYFFPVAGVSVVASKATLVNIIFADTEDRLFPPSRLVFLQ